MEEENAVSARADVPLALRNNMRGFDWCKAPRNVSEESIISAGCGFQEFRA